MKILFVTDLYPLGDEKIAKALYYFVLEWQRQGHSVEVIRSNFVFNTKLRGRSVQKEGIYTENGIKIYNLNFLTPFLFNVYNKLPKDFSLKNYDILISHMPCGALMSEKLLKRDKIKYSCAVHSSDISVLTSKLYRPYFKQKLEDAYKKADFIAARSPILKKKIEEIIPETSNKVFVAYSGIDDELVKEVSDYEAKCLDFIHTKDISVTAVASLIKRKNIDVIIKGLAELKDKNFFLRIIGDGDERENLESLTKKLGLEKNIKFLGEINRSDVFSYLKKSSLFVLLSEKETFGLSYLEAMATMNIVIALKGDGIDGILKNEENAFLISSNPSELKKCIEKIASMNEDELKNLYFNMKNTINNYKQSDAAKQYLENLQ
ncbi:glycosyltransferase [bacterium]|nr:glycosyltransferase [bacterium]